MHRSNRLTWLLVPLAAASLMWASTGVLARFSDTAVVGGNTFTTAAAWCTPGGSTLTATADTWNDQAAPTQQRGTDSSLFVMSRSAMSNRRSLVRFTLPTIPAGCTLTAGTLRLYNTSPSSGRIIDVYRANTAWVETTVTWSTQPATTGTAVGSTTVASAGYQQWTVTAQVLAHYTTNNGFLVRDRTESVAASPQQNYLSRESGSNRPQLVLTWA